MRQAQRCDVARQEVPVPEFAECAFRSLVGGRAARDQLVPAVLEVLRELIDDLGLSGGARRSDDNRSRTSRAQSRLVF